MAEKQNRDFNPCTESGCELEEKYVKSEELNPELSKLENYFTKENIENNINRAKGGVELITVGVHSIYLGEENAYNESPYVEVTDSYQYISEAGEMIDRIHEYGARVFVPLTAGEFPNCDKMDELSKEARLKEIEKVTEAFVRSAFIAKLIGYDGVQISAGQEGYLLNEFSKAFYNLSVDKDNKYHESHLKFATDIVQGIKKVCGSNFPVTLRFKVGGFVDALAKEKGIDGSAKVKLRNMPEAIDAIKVLAIAGYDALDIDAGEGNSWCLTNEPSLAENEGFLQEFNCKTEEKETPLFAYSMIENMEMAAQVLDKGITEAISMEQFLCASQNSMNNNKVEGFENRYPVI